MSLCPQEGPPEGRPGAPARADSITIVPGQGDTPRSDPPPRYLAPYLDAVDEHGATFEATLWNSREWQRARFEALHAMVDFRARRILDCGCGLADLAKFLTDGGVEYAAYMGIEASPEMLAAAERRGLPRATFALEDFVTDCDACSLDGPWDAVVFCGSLNTLEQKCLMHTLESAWNSLVAPAASRGAPRTPAPVLVFNFLSDLADRRVIRADDHGPAVRHNTRRLLEWALGRSSRVAFRSDYLPGGHDATIAVWKAP